MRILLAEDEEVTAAALRGALTSLGHEVQIATDGLMAWEMIQEEHFPVILSDWMMPGLDGPTLCRRIRSLGDSPYTYIIMMSARNKHADRMEGLRAGADDFLVKPIEAEELAVRLEIARRLISIQERLVRENARLVELATTDELTGLANRREFRRSLETSFGQAQRQKLALSLILLDIDHFKDFNDTFGHPAGDEALRTFAGTVKAACREHELAARFGGEEFGVVLFGATPEEARLSAERVREALCQCHWTNRPLKASFGIATSGPGVATVAELVEQADAALYFSKRQGRDRVTHHEDSFELPTNDQRKNEADVDRIAAGGVLDPNRSA